MRTTKTTLHKTRKKTITKSIFSKNKKAFGGVASTLIMFIAIISVTTGLVITFMNYVNNTEQSFNSQSKLTENKLRTSISISNIYYDGGGNTLYVYVKNIGETKLAMEDWDFFVDGAYITTQTYVDPTDLVTPETLSQPQDTIAISYNNVLGAGTHEVRVVTEFGVGLEESFNI